MRFPGRVSCHSTTVEGRRPISRTASASRRSRLTGTGSRNRPKNSFREKEVGKLLPERLGSGVCRCDTSSPRATFWRSARPSPNRLGGSHTSVSRTAPFAGLRWLRNPTRSSDTTGPINAVSFWRLANQRPVGPSSAAGMRLPVIPGGGGGVGCERASEEWHFRQGSLRSKAPC